MRKVDALLWLMAGVISHDLVSAYAPNGGHIPGLHAWYLAFPLLMVCLAWKEWKHD